jgi:integrase
MASNFLFEANKLLRQHSTNSFATKSERFKAIRLVDKQLVELGFKGISLKGLKTRHVEALIAKWQEDRLSSGTIKNRMAHVRWLTKKINKVGLVSASNAKLGIENRQYITNNNKGITLHQAQLDLIPDQHLKMSLRLQAAFGLRREEAMKIQPEKADRGDHLVLDASWCKGGRDRIIPILTEAQRQVLNEAKALAKDRSLIPGQRTYAQQMKRYENTCIQINLGKGHGLRHSYAHQRYLTLTGLDCPAVSGIRVSRLTTEQKAADKAAREIITRELGHGRTQVTAVYLGS